MVHPQPMHIRVTHGNESTALTCLAIGNDINYIWQRQNSSLPNKAVDRDTNVLTLPDLRSTDSGYYRCKVSNTHGTVFSCLLFV